MINYIPVDELKLKELEKENKNVITFEANENIKIFSKQIFTRNVIIKRFFGCDRKTKEDIAKEAQALSKMKSISPFIPCFINVFDRNDSFDLVMEKIDGITLEEFINRNNLSIDDKLKLFIKICNVVENLHEHNFMHRDLKPQNIIIQSSSKNDYNNINKIQPYLIDFGSSFLLERYYIGTPKYKAPELDSKKHLYDITNKVDIYSLGVILIRLLNNIDIEDLFPEDFCHFDIRDCDKNKIQLLDSLAKSMLSNIPKDRPDIRIVISKLWSIVKWKK